MPENTETRRRLDRDGARFTKADSPFGKSFSSRSRPVGQRSYVESGAEAWVLHYLLEMFAQSNVVGGVVCLWPWKEFCCGRSKQEPRREHCARLYPIPKTDHPCKRRLKIHNYEQI